MYFKKHNISTDSSSDRISQARQGTSGYLDTGNTYWLSSFQETDTKFDRFPVNDQHTQIVFSERI